MSIAAVAILTFAFGCCLGIWCEASAWRAVGDDDTGRRKESDGKLYSVRRDK